MARRLGSSSISVAVFKLTRHVYSDLRSPIHLREAAQTISISSSNSPLIRSALCRNGNFLVRFSSSADSNQTDEKRTRVNTKVNFSLPDSDSDEDEKKPAAAADEAKLPPPYNPFEKKPAIEETEDPKDLQAVFHRMRTGLTNHAVKMFDGLSKDGLTHEALHLFSQIKDKGHMPDVVAHTAVIETYADAGQPKEALKVFLRMLACGTAPNAYTYSVLIKSLAFDRKTLGEANKYLVEMMEKGMRPNPATYTAVFEGFVREEMEDSAKQLLEKMKNKGVVLDETAVKEALHSKRGHVFRTVMNILFDK